MFRRTFTVVFKPMKNNCVLLSESYFKVVSTYESGCICLTHSNLVSYFSWSPYAAVYIGDNEIGMNATVGEHLGLKEGSLVKCNLVAEAMILYSVTASATSQKDWEIIDMNSKRIQNTLLDQTRIVTLGQKLVVWINKSIHVVLKIDRLSPNLPFGKIENDTQLSIAPFVSGIIKREKEKTENYRITHCQSAIIPREQFEINEFTKINHNPWNERLTKRLKQLENITNELKKDAPNSIKLRVISGKWNESDQMSDVFVGKDVLPQTFNLNQVFVLSTKFDREYYVNIKIRDDNNSLSNGIYPTVEINKILLSQLNIEPYEKIIIKPKNTVMNFVDKIELYPSKKSTYRLREVEQQFKQFILDNSKIKSVLINRNQLFKLKDDLYVTAKILPETFKFCILDAAILRECRINAVDTVKDVDSILVTSKNQEKTIYDDKKYVTINKFDEIVDDCVERLKINLCLDERNRLRKMENFLLVGSYNSGKSTICSKILRDLSESPFNCYFDIFFCSKNKGRKPESIQKDLRQILINCMNYNPSILVLDNLDMLTLTVTEQTQEAEYFNRISDIIHNLINEYTKNSSISVIATISNVTNLNKRIYTSRGRHLFQKIIHIPELEKNDRELIIRDLCRKFKTSKKLNWRHFSNLTYGYKIGDMVQLIDRSLFYAARNDARSPILTNDIFINSLKTTNTYCLQGIENHNSNIDNHDKNDVNLKEIAGMQDVIDVLEEVIMWPLKYSNIFDNSPLRNQAGILLFGPPGTGKTYLISQIAKTWNLRMISVKGPELLAKYIGQSEENVRNLFDKARSAKPCVLFFDEFDSLAPRRGHDSTGVTDRVVNQMLTELDGVEGLHGVIVIAATSRPELLDPALLRSGRIDRLVECTLPNKDARRNIFINLSKSLNLTKNVDLNYFLDKTDNYTGADILSILTTANMNAVKECLAINSEKIPEKIEITQNHLMESFNSTRPSIAPQDIIKYRQMYARFTNKEKVAGELLIQRATLA